MAFGRFGMFNLFATPKLMVASPLSMHNISLCYRVMWTPEMKCSIIINNLMTSPLSIRLIARSTISECCATCKSYLVTLLHLGYSTMYLEGSGNSSGNITRASSYLIAFISVLLCCNLTAKIGFTGYGASQSI